MKFLIKLSSVFFIKKRFLDLVNLVFLSKLIIGEKTSRDSISGFKLISDVHVAAKFILSAIISVLLLSRILNNDVAFSVIFLPLSLAQRYLF